MLSHLIEMMIFYHHRLFEELVALNWFILLDQLSAVVGDMAFGLREHCFDLQCEVSVQIYCLIGPTYFNWSYDLSYVHQGCP
jgi:hypothetical protein